MSDMLWYWDACVTQESPPSGKRDVEGPGEQRNSDRSSPDVMHESEESEESDPEPQLWARDVSAVHTVHTVH